MWTRKMLDTLEVARLVVELCADGLRQKPPKTVDEAAAAARLEDAHLRILYGPSPTPLPDGVIDLGAARQQRRRRPAQPSPNGPNERCTVIVHDFG